MELHKWDLVPNNLCTFGCGVVETEVHLFFECKYVKALIEGIEEKLDITILSVEHVLLNDIEYSTNYVGTFVILFMKQYVYRCKCAKTKPGIVQLMKEIDYQQKVDWFNCKSVNTKVKHMEFWRPIYPALFANDEDAPHP